MEEDSAGEEYYDDKDDNDESNTNTSDKSHGKRKSSKVASIPRKPDVVHVSEFTGNMMDSDDHHSALTMPSSELHHIKKRVHFLEEKVHKLQETMEELLGKRDMESKNRLVEAKLSKTQFLSISHMVRKIMFSSIKFITPALLKVEGARIIERVLEFCKMEKALASNHGMVVAIYSAVKKAISNVKGHVVRTVRKEAELNGKFHCIKCYGSLKHSYLICCQSLYFFIFS
jgi:hypothetical protein